jgi:hypothetical protein
VHDGEFGPCYQGYEDRNPVDAHAVIALIAPRHLLMAGAMLDGCGSVFAAEQTYHGAVPVFELLGAAGNLRTTYRPDQHIGWIHPELYLDFFDIVFGRGGEGDMDMDRIFPGNLLYNFSFGVWSRSLSTQARARAMSSPVAIEGNSTNMRERVRWGLGVAPMLGPVWSPGYGEVGTGAMNYESYHEAYVDTGILTHDRWSLPDVTRQVHAHLHTT